jgi:DNA-binding CsgD family transcriptional regulator
VALLVPLTIFFICITQSLAAQNLDLNAANLAAELAGKSPEKEETVLRIQYTLEATDSARAYAFLDKLEQAGKSKGLHFQTRLNCLRGRVTYVKKVMYPSDSAYSLNNKDNIKKEITGFFSSAMDLAYQSEDDYLIAFTSMWYSTCIRSLGEVGKAVMYAKNSVDLYEHHNRKIGPENYQYLAESLYRVREYQQCVRFGLKAVNAWQTFPKKKMTYIVNCINTVALGYHRQRLFDSALVFYYRALQLARQIKDTVWVGIVSGNIGQLLYEQGRYDSAYALLKLDYKISKEKGYFDNAGNSLQWAARSNLALGHTGSALEEVREAFRLLKLWPDAGYLRNAYYTATQVFRKMGAYDSAFHYNALHAALNDSLEKVVATSSLAISKARLNDERSRYNIHSLNREKREQVLIRNIIIAAILLFALIALLFINRLRLQEKLKTEKAEAERLRMVQEMAFAREQMRLFTGNLIEKTNLIEKLEQQVNSNQHAPEQQMLFTELTRQTILTEEDWRKFRTLFEKIHPHFFAKLRQQASDITLAEQRMAALIKLQLQPKQMASLLGISPNSVYKAKQRLRQRFNLASDGQVEAFLNQF